MVIAYLEAAVVVYLERAPKIDPRSLFRLRINQELDRQFESLINQNCPENGGQISLYMDLTDPSWAGMRGIEQERIPLELAVREI